MRGPTRTWCFLALGLLVTFGGLAWVTVAALDLDRAESAARGRADREESIRLALWRMDSAVAPIVAAEGARPWFQYASFHPAQGAYTSLYRALEPGEVLIASPLLVVQAENVRIHFQVSPAGELTSPQVPVSNMLDLAQSAYVKPEVTAEMTRRLERLGGVIGDVSVLRARLEDRSSEKIPTNVGLPRFELTQPGSRGSHEFQARQIFTRNYKASQAQQGEPVSRADVHTGSLVALRVADEMLLARRVRVGEDMLIQGAWLDGDVIRRDLLALVTDLLPGASLALVAETTGETTGEDDPRRLASLPLRLEAGPATSGTPTVLTPIRIALVIAWVAALLGGLGLSTLLRGAVKLGERRAAFVSAVTHELRTPLTTFRMYTELLASDMVGEEKRAKYLETLQRESDRLGHLVENVLAYAGLERGRNGGETEDLDLLEVVDRLAPDLTEAAERADMRLSIESPADLPSIRADRSALERIIRNLVDNACKYGGSTEDRRIEVAVAERAGALALTVRDHGPGIPERDAARIFRPFRKSATEAANSAPGVGLGLSLGRELARAMGGDLSYEPAAGGGARFVLRIPVARSG